MRFPILGIGGPNGSPHVTLGKNKLSVVERGLVVTGTVVAPELELIVEGKIEGSVTAGHVLISDTGCVNGNIRANIIDVAGELHGRVEAMAVALRSSARVDATIYHHKLIIERGASVKGLQPWRPEGYMDRKQIV